MTKEINHDGLNLSVNYFYDEKSNNEYINMEGIEFVLPGKVFSK